MIRPGTIIEVRRLATRSKAFGNNKIEAKPCKTNGKTTNTEQHLTKPKGNNKNAAKPLEKQQKRSKTCGKTTKAS